MQVKHQFADAWQELDMRPEQILLDVSAHKIIVKCERYIGEEREEMFASLAFGFNVSAG